MKVPEIDFRTFVIQLAQGAMVGLGEEPDPDTKQTQIMFSQGLRKSLRGFFSDVKEKPLRDLQKPCKKKRFSFLFGNVVVSLYEVYLRC